MEFLVTTTTQVPVGTLGATVTGLQAGNAECWHDLAARRMTTSSGSFSARRPCMPGKHMTSQHYSSIPTIQPILA